jgi:hypothetical protein
MNDTLLSIIIVLTAAIVWISVVQVMLVLP